MVYYACCNDDCQCVDPVVTSSTDAETKDIGSSVPSASTGSFSSSDMIVASAICFKRLCGRYRPLDDAQEQQCSRAAGDVTPDDPQSL
jgi:hypothetical protein